MRNIPVIFSFNYVTHEIVPEVDEAFKKAGFTVLRAREDALCVGNKKLIEKTAKLLGEAKKLVEDNPGAFVAVLVHFDEFAIFDDKQLIALLGEEPFIIYVHADRESRICAFENGALVEWFRTTGSMEPDMIVCCPISVHESEGCKMQVIAPITFNYRAELPILSVRERWMLLEDEDKRKKYYLRCYRMPKYVETKIASYFYELVLKGSDTCCILQKQSETEGKFFEAMTRSLINDCTPVNFYDVSAILGTNIFWCHKSASTANFTHYDCFVSLCASDEEMNNFVNSRLYRELTNSEK